VEHLLVTYDRVPAEPTRPEGVPVTSSYCFVGVPGEPRNVKHTMELYMHKPNEYGARPVALLLVLDPSQESYTLIQPNVPLENCDTTELLKRLYPRDKFGRETELVGIKAQFQYYQPALQKVRHRDEHVSSATEKTALGTVRHGRRPFAHTRRHVVGVTRSHRRSTGTMPCPFQLPGCHILLPSACRSGGSSAATADSCLTRCRWTCA